jgi:hypothetical protein
MDFVDDDDDDGAKLFWSISVVDVAVDAVDDDDIKPSSTAATLAGPDAPVSDVSINRSGLRHNSVPSNVNESWI